MDQMLDGLEKTSGHLAVTLNLPPVNIVNLRREWAQLKDELAAIPPKNMPAAERVEQVWSDLQHAAREQDRSVFMVSSLMAISAVSHLPANVFWLSKAARSAARRTGKVLGEAILDHYAVTLRDISQQGFGAYWAREFRPYLRGAAEQFAPGRQSLTERLLTRGE
jgi:hypothetical protein